MLTIALAIAKIIESVAKLYAHWFVWRRARLNRGPSLRSNMDDWDHHALATLAKIDRATFVLMSVGIVAIVVGLAVLFSRS